jgi:hypothetical protein
LKNGFYSRFSREKTEKEELANAGYVDQYKLQSIKQSTIPCRERYRETNVVLQKPGF